MTRSTFSYRPLALVLTAAMGMVTACDQTPPNAPTRGFESGSVRATPTPTFTPLPTPIPSPTPSPEPPMVQFLGAVTDEDGVPLIGAFVEVDYQHVNGQYHYQALKTIEGGRYSAHLPARANAQLFMQPNALAVVYSYHSGYEWNVQLVSGNSSENELDFRLNKQRLIDAGASITVPVDRYTSLCADLDWDYNFKGRCANVFINVKTAGTLTVEAQSLTPGGVVPNIQAYAGSFVQGPGIVSFPVTANQWPYFIRIEVPVTAEPQQFRVVTTMK